MTTRHHLQGTVGHVENRGVSSSPLVKLHSKSNHTVTTKHHYLRTTRLSRCRPIYPSAAEVTFTSRYSGTDRRPMPFSHPLLQRQTRRMPRTRYPRSELLKAPRYRPRRLAKKQSATSWSWAGCCSVEDALVAGIGFGMVVMFVQS